MATGEEWTEHHAAFALLSAEKCTDKTILEEAAKKITHNIDAFDEVRQVLSSTLLDTVYEVIA